MKRSALPLGRQKDLVVQELKGEVLIYDLKENKAFCLNETAALVWRLCDGNREISEISESLARKLALPVTEDLVWLALDELRKANLLSEDAADVKPLFNGLSRRDAVKKIGYGTMVALPTIASLVAPRAASAQTETCVIGRRCICTLKNNIPLTTGFPCMAIFPGTGTSNCSTNLPDCDCLVTSGTNEGTCVGV